MQGHPQAYFEFDQVLASHDALDPHALVAVLPARDGLRVSRVDGLGLVAARRRDDFTHVVAGVSAAVELWDADFWAAQPEDLELDELEATPIDLDFVADAPPGVATRLLDAALAGPVIFFAPDEAQRIAWVAWLTYALPDGASLTFSTAGDEGVRVSATTEPSPDAIDTTAPCELAATFYSRVAAHLAARGGLQEAVARLQEPDGLALAVYGGATELLAPNQLPLALQLITELASSGEVALAARAAAGLPGAGPTTALALREVPAATDLAPVDEHDEIVDAEVVEEAPLELPAPIAEVVEEPGPFEELHEDEVIEVPFEAASAEPEPGPFEALHEDEVIEVPFEAAPAEPELPDEDEDEGLPDADAWSNLLAELKAESVEPDESLPPLPEIEQRRVRDRFVPPPEPVQPEPEPEPTELSVELGISLEAFAQSLSQVPEPEDRVEEALPPAEEEEVISEQEIGMSLADLEAELKKDEQP